MSPEFSIKIEKDARIDLAEAYDWYAIKGTFLANRFLTSVHETLKFLATNPFLFQIYYKNFRQAPVKIFLYLIVFKVVNKEVIVFSVFHTKRNPKKKHKN